jgi:membrane protein YdbS with pleckstrin-like domain
LQDAVAVLQVLISVGAIAHLLAIPHTTWWHPLPFVAVVLLFLALGLWIKPKTSYAVVEEPAPGGDNQDLGNRLLLAEK